MYIIEKTIEFDKWLRKLKDIRAKVGNGIHELKINYAKGYRIYFKEFENKIIILLIGGDKSTQEKDIIKAKDILKNIKNKQHGNLKI